MSGSTDHEDYLDMQTVNEFAKDQNWAKKFVIQLVFKHDPFSEQVDYTLLFKPTITALRDLINTQINGEPICEVDLMRIICGCS